MQKSWVLFIIALVLDFSLAQPRLLQGRCGMAQQQHGTVRVTQAVETSLRRPTGIHLSENLKAAVDLLLNRAVCTTARLP
jgi:hypothetical protein